MVILVAEAVDNRDWRGCDVLKRLALWLVLACLLAAVPACAEDITLTWAVYETANYTPEYYQYIIDAFERDNPGIHIEKMLMTGDSRARYLQTMLSAGTMPDINIDPIDLAGVAGVYAQAPDWLLARFDPSTVVESDGRRVLIPAFTAMRAQVFYNKAQFAAAGIHSLPDTPDAFADICAKLSAAGFTPLVTAGPKTVWATDFGIWTGMINSDLIAEYPDFNADLLTGRVKWNNPVLRRDLEYWTKLIHAGYYHRASMSLSYNQACEEFMQGNAAMILDGPWLAATIDNSGDDTLRENVGCFAMPNFSGAKTYCVLPQYWAVSERCAHKDEAFRFCDYVLGGNGDIYRYYLQADCAFSVTREIVSYPLGELQSEFMSNFDGCERVVEITKLAGDGALPSGFEDSLHRAMQQVFTGANIYAQLNALDREFRKLVS